MSLFHVLSPNACVLLLSSTSMLRPLTAFLPTAQFIIRKKCHIAPVRINALLWPAAVLASFVQNFHSSWAESVCICLGSMYNCWQSLMQVARCTMSVPFRSAESWRHPFHVATRLPLDTLFQGPIHWQLQWSPGSVQLLSKPMTTVCTSSGGCRLYQLWHGYQPPSEDLVCSLLAIVQGCHFLLS